MAKPPSDDDQPQWAAPLSEAEAPSPYWAIDESRLFAQLGSGPGGLTEAEATSRQKGKQDRLEAHGASDRQLLFRQFRNPIILLLVVAALLSAALRDVTDAVIIVLIIGGSGGLGFIQERGAVRAVESLLATVRVDVEVIRAGKQVSVPLTDVVVGDVIHLGAGDIIPGDCRVLTSNALQANESALTGESEPKPKTPGLLAADSLLTERDNSLLYGTHIVSGEGTALVALSGSATEFGHVSARLATQHVPTSFERGINAFGYLLVRATSVLVVGVLIINLLLSRPFVESILFSLALAVGLTPQLLPAIVTVSLAHGAASIAKRSVIVKRLDAIEDIGSMNVLCTDKTGTLTVGTLQVAQAVGWDGGDSPHVAQLAWWNARYQKGFENPIDTAILAAQNTPTEERAVLGVVPYDFQRRRQSVLLEDGGTTLLVSKGAFEPILALSTNVRAADGTDTAVSSETRDRLTQEFERLSAAGYRVLGVAERRLPVGIMASPELEVEMTFAGFLAFSDPPKPGAAEAVAELRERGVRTCMITGDNRLAAAHVAKAVGVLQGEVKTGREIAAMTDEELASIVATVDVFAEIDPLQKERIVRAFSLAGNTVGYLGDGINDAPALHAADVGISVEGAVDVARHTADLVLLEKDLAVLGLGIEEGRRVFTNTMKYVFVTTSANFGNMLSMAGASLVLPFLPLLPRQILLLNFLSDVPGATIASDRVDPDQVEHPRSWNVHNIRNFMIVFGVVSSAFDYLAFAILKLGLNADAVTFRTAWFMASTVTELAAMLVLRTPRPFFRSRPGRALMWSSLAVAVVTIALPYTPLAKPLGFDAPGIAVAISMAGVVLGYVVATELTKLRLPGLLK